MEIREVFDLDSPLVKVSNILQQIMRQIYDYKNASLKTRLCRMLSLTSTSELHQSLLHNLTKMRELLYASSKSSQTEMWLPDMLRLRLYANEDADSAINSQIDSFSGWTSMSGKFRQGRSTKMHNEQNKSKNTESRQAELQMVNTPNQEKRMSWFQNISKNFLRRDTGTEEAKLFVRQQMAIRSRTLNSSILSSADPQSTKSKRSYLSSEKSQKSKSTNEKSRRDIPHSHNDEKQEAPSKLVKQVTSMPNMANNDNLKRVGFSILDDKSLSPAIRRVIRDNLTSVANTTEQPESWNFDIFELQHITEGFPLTAITLYIFNALDYGRIFSINPEILLNFIRIVEDQYSFSLISSRINSYHNSLHASDAVQAIYTFLHLKTFSEKIPVLEKFCLLFAGIIHDFKHRFLFFIFYFLRIDLYHYLASK